MEVGPRDFSAFDRFWSMLFLTIYMVLGGLLIGNFVMEYINDGGAVEHKSGLALLNCVSLGCCMHSKRELVLTIAKSEQGQVS